MSTPGIRRFFATLVAAFIATFVASCPLPLHASPASLSAQWIWAQQSDVHGYNQTIFARKSFRAEACSKATLKITADSWYRVMVNGQWVNDGPSRAWPEHFQYDVLDVSTYLTQGQNEIQVIARYYGTGDFHRVPRQAGLIAELTLLLPNGKTQKVATDASWEACIAPGWLVETPKVSIQMEPCEIYDARLAGKLQFKKAKVLFDADRGPWKDLNPRESALLSRQPFAPRTFGGAKIVRASGWNYCMPAARLVHPNLIEANHATSCASGMATILVNDQPCEIAVQTEGMTVVVDGERVGSDRQVLSPGRHLVVSLVQEVFGHDKEKATRFMNPAGFRLENPLRATYENPWCFLRFPEFAVATNDVRWIGFRDQDPRMANANQGYAKMRDSILSSVKGPDSFQSLLGKRAELLPPKTMFVRDIHWLFMQRQVLGDATSHVRNPAGLLHDNAEMTVIEPSSQGDVELLYDLGEQNCGYYDFDLVADAGVEVDIFGLEYITPEGRLQHSNGNRNGMRYITKQGANRFTSLKRRSGRYLFVTLRNQKAPVSIRKLQLIESTYPVHYAGSFRCSDARLDEIWNISTRTLKLCMEDTFTDCPLYEQTHWVGDARNESLLAFGVFGAHDLARRCIDITAQSLEHYPIAGCQTPSCWDCILPAWSFLWGISTWDYYWATGDAAYLKQIYPSVIRNLKGAENYIDANGLFSGTFWNLFDWSGIDQGPKAVLHNSMFLVGAIDAALKEADVLGDSTHVAWLEGYRSRLVNGVNRLWDPAKNSYPDSIRDDGSISPSTCQHTSFLSVLYDVIQKDNVAAAVKNLTSPPEKMVRIGSPFAVLYLYETYEKLGMDDEILKEIYKNYLPMIESGATTVWESFPTGTTGSDGFPTRSHCHAWSSAPSRFLNRILLGVKETAPAGKAVQISPRLNGLTWASGTTATVQGPVSASWKLEGKTLDVTYSAPAATKATFVRNDSHNGLTVRVNGKTLD
jgi:alpha-L-rhamnosidase